MEIEQILSITWDLRQQWLEGGRSQSAYGQSTQAIHNWDDGWESSQFPEPHPVYANLSLVCGRPDKFHGTETIEPPFTELSLKYAADKPRLKAVVRAAETGNDQLIDFLMSCSLADADQPPIPGETITSSTPMLAAIGRENIKVIEVLLKQKDFNPTRQFSGLTYYEIAEERRGLVWEEEVRLLKQAFNYAHEHKNIDQNNTEQVTSNVAANRPCLDHLKISVENVNDSSQAYLYDCTWCRYSFSHEDQLKFHEEKCSARPFSGNIKLGLTHEKLTTHLRLQASSPIRPIRLPVRSTPTAEFHTIDRTVNNLDISTSTSQPRCHSTGPRGCGEKMDIDTIYPGSLRSGIYLMDSPMHSTFITSDNFRGDCEAIKLPTETRYLMAYSREKAQVSEGYHAPEFPMTDSSTPQISASSVRHTSETTSPFTIPSQGESEASEFSMNESSEDCRWEEESSFVQRAERRRTLLRGLMDMVYATYTRLATSGAMEDGESGPSNAPGGGSGSANSSNNQQNKGNDVKGKRPLPRGDGSNGGEEGDDQQQPKRRKPATYNDGTNPGERFACPYYQRNRYRHLPRNYSLKGACYGPGFHSVHRVKEHLYRAHRLPPYCSRCNVAFDSDISLEKHTRQDLPCELTPKQLREGIDPTTEKLLRIRNKEFNSKTEEDKWRHVYTVLFPADDPVDLPSPYYGNYLERGSVESSPELRPTARSYDEFLQRELFRRIYRVLENKIDEALDSAERDVADALKSQLEGIIRDVQAELYGEFQSSIRQKQAIDETNGIATQTPIPGPDPMLLLQDMLPLSSFSPPWSALSLENQQASSSSAPEFANGLEDISNLRFDLLSNPFETSQNHDSAMVIPVPFTAKAAYDYISDHEEDLSFRIGQIITVTSEEETDWYNGEYVDDFGMKNEGIFPRNLVERYPPPVPPRPMRGRKENAGSVATTFPSSFPPY
ncbi:hypothetical protein F5Y00DRAFT_113196 [Daldinia vernicosa]|uniref:uncharacterized protein n=1 Tax=Daldinia vernicosa TaxID=114800 RepID=UPI0020072DBE|nr:uncharacterized protein F5Y00DRAFT_113196 [Daldinia vernicosa]KAI0847623.1 hypothetical protein F5Y00DRAFT_113196 [Daldinia vernicosa]